MSGYVGSDGSQLAGGLNPSSVIQGLQVDNGGNLKVTGSISASNPSVGSDGSAIPTSSTLIGASDGTNLQPCQVDGSKNLKVNVAAGAVTANAGTNLNTSALALEAGGNLAAASTTLGATGDAAVVGDNSGTLSAKLRGLTKILNDIWDSINHRIKVDGSGVTQPVSAASLPLPTNAAQETGGNLATLAGAIVSAIMQANIKQVNGSTVSVNSGSIDGGTQRVNQGGAGTGTKSNVASSASSVTILASNTSRKGALVYNDSTQVLYLDLSGGAATTSSYSVQVPANGYFELPGPAIYNGAITGIWAAANGNARVTEFS